MTKVYEMIRYTTPTFVFSFKQLNAVDIDKAVLTIEQGGTKIQNDNFHIHPLAGTNAIYFTLSQEDTATLQEGYATAVCDYLLVPGYNSIRSRSKMVHLKITSPGVESVMINSND